MTSRESPAAKRKSTLSKNWRPLLLGTLITGSYLLFVLSHVKQPMWDFLTHPLTGWHLSVPLLIVALFLARSFLDANFKLTLGLLISADCLYYFIRMCKGEEMWVTVKQANVWFVLLTLACIFACYWARGVRWTFLLRPLKRVKVGASFSATIIGFTASNVLPMRAGEFVRAYVLGKNENIRATSTFATIVVERLCDGFCVLAILVLALTVMPFPEAPDPATLSAQNLQKIVAVITIERLRYFGYSTLGLYLGIISVLVFLHFAPKKTELVISKLLFFAPKTVIHKVTETLQSFSEGIASINTPRQAGNVVLWSLITWGLIVFAPWLMALAFDLTLPIYMGFFVTAILSLAVMLPSSPGFLGIFQVAVAAAMVLLGVPEQVATSYALVLWALSIIPVTILGFTLCWVGKTSFMQIIRASKEERMATRDDSARS
ncbi:MAG: flippase-like domain-containing protein [Candidatus Coatesbacteria bacterium]|nr:flippase-like domain-containing protein [Candidatus Coatesbacteria bacterium]